MKKTYALILLCFVPMWALAQVGEHRNQFAIGFQAGCNFNSVDFIPKVNDDTHIGPTGGLVARYTCEKYFKTICSIQMEFNYSQLGWKEKIRDANDKPVPIRDNPEENERFKHDIYYFQIPILAHLAWGKEKQGLNFFFNAGPVLGFYLKDKCEANFTPETVNNERRGYQGDNIERLKKQLEEKEKEPKKFDYGIAAGLGLELHIKPIGRFQIEGRYYYGLGNLYGDSKTDCFSRSAHQTIILRGAYLIDI